MILQGNLRVCYAAELNRFILHKIYFSSFIRPEIGIRQGHILNCDFGLTEPLSVIFKSLIFRVTDFYHTTMTRFRSIKIPLHPRIVERCCLEQVVSMAVVVFGIQEIAATIDIRHNRMGFMPRRKRRNRIPGIPVRTCKLFRRRYPNSFGGGWRHVGCALIFHKRVISVAELTDNDVDCSHVGIASVKRKQELRRRECPEVGGQYVKCTFGSPFVRVTIIAGDPCVPRDNVLISRFIVEHFRGAVVRFLILIPVSSGNPVKNGIRQSSALPCQQVGGTPEQRDTGIFFHADHIVYAVAALAYVGMPDKSGKDSAPVIECFPRITIARYAVEKRSIIGMSHMCEKVAACSTGRKSDKKRTSCRQTP